MVSPSASLYSLLLPGAHPDLTHAAPCMIASAVLTVGHAILGSRYFCAYPICLLRLPSIDNLSELKVARSIEHKILGCSADRQLACLH